MMRSPAPKPRPPDGEIMNVGQVADYLDCHPATIRGLLRRRKIAALRLGSDWRLRRADIEIWIAAPEIQVSSEEDEVDRKHRARQPAGKKPGRLRKS
jgi:excisionase family DNA binding protein